VIGSHSSTGFCQGSAGIVSLVLSEGVAAGCQQSMLDSKGGINPFLNVTIAGIGVL